MAADLARLESFRDDTIAEVARIDPVGYWDAQIANKALPIEVERIGPSYRVDVRPLEAAFVFRDVRTTGELSADVTVLHRSGKLFRTTVTLSLAGREKIAKTAKLLARDGSAEDWQQATFAAVEAVLDAEEQLGAPTDLRKASLERPTGGTHAAKPIWPMGSVVLVSPGDAGKSTIARAIAVSLAAGVEVIPGIEPIGPPRSVLFVAAEDPVPYWHSRSIEAICRGASLERANLPQPVELFDAHGRPLHRMVRAIAERASDHGAVILDSQQALLAQLDPAAGIRDRDSLFWNAVDQLEVPVFIIAHPNRADARGWEKADGRIAGSEVNRDRARMAWRGTWKDEKAVEGTSYRRYTLENVKNNHGPKEAPISFGAYWTFGMGDDPGALTFGPGEPVANEVGLSRELSEALDAWREGHRTPAPLAAKLGIPINTAKSRLRLLRERDLIEGSGPDA